MGLKRRNCEYTLNSAKRHNAYANKGNFLELIHLVAKYDFVLENHIDSESKMILVLLRSIKSEMKQAILWLLLNTQHFRHNPIIRTPVSRCSHSDTADLEQNKCQNYLSLVCVFMFVRFTFV